MVVTSVAPPASRMCLHSILLNSIENLIGDMWRSSATVSVSVLHCSWWWRYCEHLMKYRKDGIHQITSMSDEICHMALLIFHVSQLGNEGQLLALT